MRTAPGHSYLPASQNGQEQHRTLTEPMFGSSVPSLCRIAPLQRCQNKRTCNDTTFELELGPSARSLAQRRRREREQEQRNISRYTTPSKILDMSQRTLALTTPLVGQEDGFSALRNDMTAKQVAELSARCLAQRRRREREREREREQRNISRYGVSNSRNDTTPEQVAEPSDRSLAQRRRREQEQEQRNISRYTIPNSILDMPHINLALTSPVGQEDEVSASHNDTSSEQVAEPSTRTMAGNVSSEGPVNEQAIANMFSILRSEMNQLYSKITELEMEVSEHSLVERTIKEVLPAVHRNKECLEEVTARLNEALEKKKKEIADFELKHEIKVRRSDADANKDDASQKEGTVQGVLVGPAANEGK